MAVVSSFYWSGFPFDNICPNNSIDADYLTGPIEVTPFYVKDRPATTVEFASDDVDYRYCNQDLLSPREGRSFPFTPDKQPDGDEWMTDDQEIVTLVFGWSSVAITALVILTFVWGWVGSVRSLFQSSYEVSLMLHPPTFTFSSNKIIVYL